MKEQNTHVTYTRSELDALPDETDWERVDALTDEDTSKKQPYLIRTIRLRMQTFGKMQQWSCQKNMEEYTQREIMGIINEIVKKLQRWQLHLPR